MLAFLFYFLLNLGFGFAVVAVCLFLKVLVERYANNKDLKIKVSDLLDECDGWAPIPVIAMILWPVIALLTFGWIFIFGAIHILEMNADRVLYNPSKKQNKQQIENTDETR